MHDFTTSQLANMRSATPLAYYTDTWTLWPPLKKKSLTLVYNDGTKHHQAEVLEWGFEFGFLQFSYKDKKTKLETAIKVPLNDLHGYIKYEGDEITIKNVSGKLVFDGVHIKNNPNGEKNPVIR